MNRDNRTEIASTSATEEERRIYFRRCHSCLHVHTASYPVTYCKKCDSHFSEFPLSHTQFEEEQEAFHHLQITEGLDSHLFYKLDGIEVEWDE